MKIFPSILIAALALSFGEISQVSAQMNNSSVGTYGMFGYRIIGVPSQGVTSPGMFGNRYLGPNLNSINTIGQYATGPSIQYRGQSAYSTYAIPSTGLVTNVTQNVASTPDFLNNLSEQPNLQEAVPQPNAMLNEANGYNPNGVAPNGYTPNGTENLAPSVQAPAASSGVQTPAGSQNAAMPAIPFPHGWGYASLASTPSSIAFAHSPVLSDRLTQIAKNRGMLVGRRIEVSISGNVAKVQGVVQTSNDCMVLANVLGLEPGVQRIENRLTTVQEAAESPNAKR